MMIGGVLLHLKTLRVNVRPLSYTFVENPRNSSGVDSAAYNHSAICGECTPW